MPLTPQGTPAWLDEVAEKCARVASCAHAHDPPRLRDPSACVDWWIARVRAREDRVHVCLGAAKSCSDVGACVRDKPDARAAVFCGAHKGVMTACDGPRLVSCAEDDDSESTSVDCGSLGGACEERRAAGGLVVRGCFSPKMCPQGAPDERCEGNAVVACRDGAAERTACGPATKCDEHVEANGERGATCEPVSGHAHCAQLGQRFCRDDLFVECIVHGHYGDARVTDCKGLGLRCAPSGCVVAKASDCQPGPPRCDGEALAFCAAGHMVKVSCKTLGLGACDPDAQGPAASCRSAP